MSNHFKKTFNSISKNQWIGLLLGYLASTLVWLKLLLIIDPLKNNNNKKNIKIKKFSVSKFQIYALLVGWLITTIVWAKALMIIDPINNKIFDNNSNNNYNNNSNNNCECKCKQ